MKDTLNQRIKHREPFRPFAPSILEEAVGDYFERSRPSPFMNLACRVRADKQVKIPAPTHVDGTGRLQTVSRQTNPLYWSLLKEFENLTGVPVVLNTSFNENEPIVCTPEEALNCFLAHQDDVLVLAATCCRRKSQRCPLPLPSARVPPRFPPHLAYAHSAAESVLSPDTSATAKVAAALAKALAEATSSHGAGGASLL